MRIEVQAIQAAFPAVIATVPADTVKEAVAAGRHLMAREDLCLLMVRVVVDGKTAEVLL